MRSLEDAYKYVRTVVEDNTGVDEELLAELVHTGILTTPYKSMYNICMYLAFNGLADNILKCLMSAPDYTHLKKIGAAIKKEILQPSGQFFDRNNLRNIALTEYCLAGLLTVDSFLCQNFSEFEEFFPYPGNANEIKLLKLGMNNSIPEDLEDQRSNAFHCGLLVGSHWDTFFRFCHNNDFRFLGATLTGIEQRIIEIGRELLSIHEYVVFVDLQLVYWINFLIKKSEFKEALNDYLCHDLHRYSLPTAFSRNEKRMAFLSVFVPKDLINFLENPDGYVEAGKISLKNGYCFRDITNKQTLYSLIYLSDRIAIRLSELIHHGGFKYPAARILADQAYFGLCFMMMLAIMNANKKSSYLKYCHILPIHLWNHIFSYASPLPLTVSEMRRVGLFTAQKYLGAKLVMNVNGNPHTTKEIIERWSSIFPL